MDANKENKDFTRKDAVEEVVAQAMTDMLLDQKTVNELAERIAAEKPSLIQKIIKVIDKIISRIKSFMTGESLKEARLSKTEINGVLEYAEDLRKAFVDMTVNARENMMGAKEADAMQESEAEDLKFSQRDFSYNAFVNKPDMELTVISNTYQGKAKDVVAEAKNNAFKIGKKDTQTGNPLVYVKDIDRYVMLSSTGLRHGLDSRFGVNAPVTIKAGEIVENAILVNKLTPKKEAVNESYVLIGAAKNKNNELQIVQFVVNSITDEITSIDVVYSINAKADNLGIKNKRLGASYSPKLTGNPATLTASTIKIAHLLDYVNRYFPDILPEGVLRHYGYTERPDGVIGKSALYQQRDEKYLAAVNSGDMETAQKMVDEAAKEAGYLKNSDYQGSLAFNGSAPAQNGYFLTKEERKEAWENGNYEGTMSLGDYADNGIDTNDLEWELNNPIAASGRDRNTLASIRNLNATLKSGKKSITMYRAVRGDISENSFRNGDWITPSKEYAEHHIDLQDWESGRIISQEVPIDHIWWNGDDINEWGYDDGRNYAYKNVPNNRKLFDPVTYDDEGNVIPLSERFNEGNEDIRYQNRPIDEDSLYPNNQREQSVFNRSMANKTSDLKDGDVRRIIINTADNTYFVIADGYLTGEIYATVPIDGNEEKLKIYREAFKNGTDSFGEVNDSLPKRIRSNGRRDARYYDDAEYGRKTGANGNLDDESYGSGYGRGNGSSSQDLSGTVNYQLRSDGSIPSDIDLLIEASEDIRTGRFTIYFRQPNLSQV